MRRRGRESDDEPVYDDETSEDELTAAAPDLVADPETWMDYWSEELVGLWHALRERCESGGYAILDSCGPASFTEFTDLCFRLSSGRKPTV